MLQLSLETVIGMDGPIDSFLKYKPYNYKTRRQKNKKVQKILADLQPTYGTRVVPVIRLAIRVHDCTGVVTLMRKPSMSNYLIPIVMSIVPLRHGWMVQLIHF
ncbi:hypothetical protein HanIR_Chr07g0332871 [Helianthus annuus]|nr:hypothetical protein HanIR_Chr07g0332871 [Helianthus annuus]